MASKNETKQANTHPRTWKSVKDITFDQTSRSAAAKLLSRRTSMRGRLSVSGGQEAGWARARVESVPGRRLVSVDVHAFALPGNRELWGSNRRGKKRGRQNKRILLDFEKDVLYRKTTLTSIWDPIFFFLSFFHLLCWVFLLSLAVAVLINRWIHYYLF